MKKSCLIFMCVILLFLLCGCINRQNNNFEEGLFTNEEYRLTVTAIDEETFARKNGINVVEDTSVNRKNQYYEIVLYKLGKEGGTELTFSNLTFSGVTTAEPCFYEDQSGNSISPFIIQGRMGYIITYNKECIKVVGD